MGPRDDQYFHPRKKGEAEYLSSRKLYRNQHVEMLYQRGLHIILLRHYLEYAQEIDTNGYVLFYDQVDDLVVQ